MPALPSRPTTTRAEATCAEQSRPDWNRLYETAAAQEGLFTTQQGAEAGYSPQLLVHCVRAGRALRVRRGIYRLVHFPAGEHEDLVTACLWLERAGGALAASGYLPTSCSTKQT